MMANDLEKKRAILKFCEGLFATSNLIGTDFDDVNVMQVKGRDFVQQPRRGRPARHVLSEWACYRESPRDQPRGSCCAEARPMERMAPPARLQGARSAG